MVGNFLTKPQQHPEEIAAFLTFLQEKQIRSFLEIGSKFGGTIWLVSRIMRKRSRVVSVELPNSEWGRSDSQPSIEQCFIQLRREGFDAHLLLGDSTDATIVDRVKRLAPFDAALIDANHTEPYVRRDFANYGRLTRIVCFHDIVEKLVQTPGKKDIEVPKVWRELKTTYKDAAEFTEIAFDEHQNGIGIMEWR